MLNASMNAASQQVSGLGMQGGSFRKSSRNVDSLPLGGVRLKHFCLYAVGHIRASKGRLAPVRALQFLLARSPERDSGRPGLARVLVKALRCRQAACMARDRSGLAPVES